MDDASSCQCGQLSASGCQEMVIFQPFGLMEMIVICYLSIEQGYGQNMSYS